MGLNLFLCKITLFTLKMIFFSFKNESSNIYLFLLKYLANWENLTEETRKRVIDQYEAGMIIDE